MKLAKNHAPLRLPCVFALSAQLIVVSVATAAPLAVGVNSPRSAWIESGWDPTFLGGIGVSFPVAAPAQLQSLRLDVFSRMPLALAFTGDAWELGGGATAAARRGALGVVLAADTSLRHALDDTGRKLGLASTLTMRPGWFGARSAVTADLAWSAILLGRMWHADSVRDLFRDRFPGDAGASPEATWFGLAAHRFRAGLRGAMLVGAAVTLEVAGGYAYTPQLKGISNNPPVGPLPFFAEAAGSFRW